MFGLLGILLSTAVDFIVKKADLRRSELGPMKLYGLYVSLRDIIKNAKLIVKEVEDTIRDKSHGAHIIMEINR